MVRGGKSSSLEKNPRKTDDAQRIADAAPERGRRKFPDVVDWLRIEGEPELPRQERLK